jgi:purine-nucleoside phosphorylase
MNEALVTAVQYLKTRLPSTPVVGVILGSGLGDFAESIENPTTIGYDEIPEFPRSAVVGHAGKLYYGVVDQVPVVVLSGRIHYYEGHSMSSVVFPARVLGRLGCRTVIVTNAAGGINTRYKSGDLMLISDHINAFGANPLMGPNDDDLGPRFPDMSDAYRKDLREVARRAAEKAGVKLQEGVYIGVHGPSYETPAEIRSLRSWGADAVGMSTVPEVIALNQMGVGVVGLSCITNMAAGVLPQKLDHKEVLETTQRVKGEIVRFLRATVAALGPAGEPDARGAKVGGEAR